jgi:hypothetical protein
MPRASALDNSAGSSIGPQPSTPMLRARPAKSTAGSSMAVPIRTFGHGSGRVPLIEPPQVPLFLVEGVIVVHHDEQRDAVMRERPQDAARHQQIAVRLDADAESSMFAVRESRTGRCRRGVADALAAGPPHELIVPGEIPEPQRPVVHAPRERNERPVEMFDLAPQLARQSRRADRPRIPVAARRLIDARLHLEARVQSIVRRASTKAH